MSCQLCKKFALILLLLLALLMHFMGMTRVLILFLTEMEKKTTKISICLL